MSTTERFNSFSEFWPHYVGEHRKPFCRAIHYAGAIVAVGALAAALIWSNWLLILIAPVAGYGLAWLGHFCVEHNKPATWRYVWWSIRGESKMFGLALVGRMGKEIERLYGSRNPGPEAPLR